MAKPELPKVDVQLLGDDVAFLMLNKVRRALKKAQVPDDKVQAFTREAMAGNQRVLIEACLAVTK